MLTGGLPMTAGVGSDCALEEPDEFVAVTSMRSDQPIRSPVGMKTDDVAPGVKIQ